MTTYDFLADTAPATRTGVQEHFLSLARRHAAAALEPHNSDRAEEARLALKYLGASLIPHTHNLLWELASDDGHRLAKLACSAALTETARA